ncbi:lipopolysaccharide heptosyltransferase II [bacterium]|nr:lipopolysaccharide heptosyltransferase II [bacterium]MBU1752871.1 lipopolysaccharide heptosyltransferase II [bacterium]
MKEYKKILIIQTAFIGDVVLATPLIQSLSKGFPGAKLYLLTTPKGNEVLNGDPCLANIIPYDKKGQQKGIFHFLKVAEELRKMKFDLAVVPHPSFRSSLLAFLCGIPHRIGFDRNAMAFLFTSKVPYQLKFHEAKRNLELAYALGSQKEDYPLRIYISNKDREISRDFISKNGVLPGDPLIGINPCSVWPTKRWIPERFAQVSDALANEFKARIILVGGREDGWLVEKIALPMKTRPILAAGRLTLKQLAGVMERCQLFITNDSGPLHIAMAMKTPTVAIFGPTTINLGFGPYGESFRVVEKAGLSCRPCGKHGGQKCPLKSFNCMKEITSDDVMAAARELIQGSCRACPC